MKSILRRRTLIILITGFAIIVALRLALPSLILSYVNKTLDQIPEYDAKIESIDVSLWRGAYVIHNLRMVKKGGQNKYPFLHVKKIDLSMEWRALFSGKIVGEVEMFQPVLNFVRTKSKETSQLTGSKSWADQGEKLFPFEINKFSINDGKITFRELGIIKGADLSMTSMHLVLTGITNVETKTDPLPSKLMINAKIFETGNFWMKGSAQLLHDPISFDMDTSIKGVELSKLNHFVKHHAGFKFKSGTFSCYSTLKAVDGKVNGYLKPLLEDVRIIDQQKLDNPLEIVWQVFIATVVEIFTNQSTNRFATVIPIKGEIDNPDAEILSTIFNVVRNAFIKAFQPGFEKLNNS